MAHTTSAVGRMQQTIRLHDGRTLGWAEYGDPAGAPLFYLHGMPGSRLDLTWLDGDERAKQRGVRVLAVDRPGIGLSSFQPHHRFTDWPLDLSCLADHLHLERFALVSYSAGSAYALACAGTLSQRLTAVGVVSGLAQPFNAPDAARGMRRSALWRTAHIHPRLTWLLLSLVANPMLGGNHSRCRGRTGRLQQADADFIYLKQHPGLARRIIASDREILRQGGLGPAQNAALYWKPWGYNLEDIQARVHLWHGEEDMLAPFDLHGRVLADKLPHAVPQFYPHDGHVSLIHQYLGDILATLRDAS